MQVEKELNHMANSVMDGNCRQVAERWFRGEDWRFEQGEERELTVSLPIPVRCLALML
jgi:hypothetical protein